VEKSTWGVAVVQIQTRQWNESLELGANYCARVRTGSGKYRSD